MSKQEPQIQQPQEDKPREPTLEELSFWKKLNSTAWYLIPIFAVLLIGIFAGMYIEGKHIADVLSQNVSLCKDPNGNLLGMKVINMTNQLGNFNPTQEQNYSVN